MSRTSETEEATQSKDKAFGLPWPDLNDGLFYNDVVSASDSKLTLIEFYSTKHKNSAPLQGKGKGNISRTDIYSMILLEMYELFAFIRHQYNIKLKHKLYLRCFLRNQAENSKWTGKIFNLKQSIWECLSDFITIDCRVVKDPESILSAGSELVYHRLPWKEPDAPYMLEVLYEDNDMIALNKPSGLQVLPGGLFQQRTVLKQLQWQASKQISSQDSHPVPVHRLGRGTSGILLCAKTKLAKSCLAAYFADGTSVVAAKSNANMKLCTRKISKIYRALVSGIVEEDKIIIKQPIGIMRYPGVAKGLYIATPSGKPALSNVEVLERDLQGNHTLIQVAIQSGRPHQIRIHLAFIGHPLVGDPLYVAGGQPRSFDSVFAEETFAQDGGYPRPATPVPGDCGYHLHAHQLVLSHPTTNEVIQVTAPVPSVLQTQEEAKEMNI